MRHRREQRLMQYRYAAASAASLIAADLPPGDALLRAAVARAVELAPEPQRSRWQARLDALDAGHTLRFKIRDETSPVLTPELLREVESAFAT
jgi:hypothetical protein